jgi:hypothetical protein
MTKKSMNKKMGFLENEKIPFVISLPGVLLSIPIRQEAPNETNVKKKIQRPIDMNVQPIHFSKSFLNTIVERKSGRKFWNLKMDANASSSQMANPTNSDHSRNLFISDLLTPKTNGFILNSNII